MEKLTAFALSNSEHAAEFIGLIHFHERQKIRLLIFDLNGKLVQILFASELSTGAQTILWDAPTDSRQRRLFYEPIAGNQFA